MLGLASLKCTQTYLFPLWYSPYYVLCIFKCVKHHACLAGPWDSRWKRDRLCFLSHGDFALVFLYHFVGLLRKFYQFIHILCAQRAKCTFPPAQGNARERKCAKPQCKKQCLLHCRAFSQQTGRLHAHIGNCKTKKRNSQAHILECLRAISVPANLLPAGAITKACCCRRPLYMPPHFADGAFGIAVSG